jgi:hypothetical protein
MWTKVTQERITSSLRIHLLILDSEDGADTLLRNDALSQKMPQFAIIISVKMTITSGQSANLQNNFQFTFIKVIPFLFGAEYIL